MGCVSKQARASLLYLNQPTNSVRRQTEMTKRRKRRARVVREEPEAEEVLEELEEEIEELEEAPSKRKRRKVVEPEPEAPPKRKRKVARKVELEPEEPASSEDLLNCILEGLDDGQSMTITRESDTSWVLAVGGVVEVAPATQKLSGKAYSDEVRSQEFQDHAVVWKELSFEEKLAHAEKLDVQWKEHDDPRVEVIRVTAAVREKLGIEKYKPQYRTRAARAAIRA